jgi:hypothetical protein
MIIEDKFKPNGIIKRKPFLGDAVRVFNTFFTQPKFKNGTERSGKRVAIVDEEKHTFDPAPTQSLTHIYSPNYPEINNRQTLQQQLRDYDEEIHSIPRLIAYQLTHANSAHLHYFMKTGMESKSVWDNYFLDLILVLQAILDKPKTTVFVANVVSWQLADKFKNIEQKLKNYRIKYSETESVFGPKIVRELQSIHILIKTLKSIFEKLFYPTNAQKALNTEVKKRIIKRLEKIDLDLQTMIERLIIESKPVLIDNLKTSSVNEYIKIFTNQLYGIRYLSEYQYNSSQNHEDDHKHLPFRGYEPNAIGMNTFCNDIDLKGIVETAKEEIDNNLRIVLRQNTFALDGYIVKKRKNQ